MFASNAYRYYRENYDRFGKFDRGLPALYYNLLSVFFLLLFRSGLGALFKLVAIRRVLSKKLAGQNIVSFAFSVNQYTIHNALTELGFSFPIYDFIGQGSPSPGKNHFSTRFLFLSAMANAKSTYLELQNAKNDMVLYHNGIRLVKLCGLEFIYSRLLDDVKVTIQYNDHTPYCVLLHDMAEARKIKTVYIQHAPVSERFPPLYHDLNVLFSQDSVDKYKMGKRPVKILIIFDVRFVLWKSVEGTQKECVLLCPNHWDDITVVKALADELSENYKVIIRPHPADDRMWKGNENSEVSVGNTVWADIAKAKYVLTNESAVILEAICAGRLCYKCAFFSNSFDNYGFVRKGLLLREYFSQADVVKAIRAKEIAYDKRVFPYFAGDINAKEQKIEMLKHEILHLRDQVPR